MKHCLLLIALTMACCTQSFTTTQLYKDTPVQIFAHGGERWRVFDKPEIGTMMIQASAQSSLITTDVGEFPASTGNTVNDAAVFRSVADSFLKPRGCSVVNATNLLGWAYEFAYTC